MQTIPSITERSFHLDNFNTRPLIISGPCSAETEAQVLATAQGLKSTGLVDVLRAGIWKPRTRPGSFEGVGTKGLPWLQKARAATGLPIATEVATAGQVEDALHFEVDALWIGARSTANPFSVQGIADALKGVDIPVLIKNPINPDIGLWSGAIERLNHAGIKQLGLIHRGFSSTSNEQYRNAPFWHLAMEMKSRNPDIMMLNDPSHISGRRDGLQAIIQKAASLNFDGFIIESHHDPGKAWSDAAQQVTPKMLEELLLEINLIREKKGNHYFSDEDILIQQMDQLEDELHFILNKRNQIESQLKINLKKCC